MVPAAGAGTALPALAGGSAIPPAPVLGFSSFFFPHLLGLFALGEREGQGTCLDNFSVPLYSQSSSRVKATRVDKLKLQKQLGTNLPSC